MRAKGKMKITDEGQKMSFGLDFIMYWYPVGPYEAGPPRLHRPPDNLLRIIHTAYRYCTRYRLQEVVADLTRIVALISLLFSSSIDQFFPLIPKTQIK